MLLDHYLIVAELSACLAEERLKSLFGKLVSCNTRSYDKGWPAVLKPITEIEHLLHLTLFTWL